MGEIEVSLVPGGERGGDCAGVDDDSGEDVLFVFVYFDVGRSLFPLLLTGEPVRDRVKTGEVRNL